MHMITSCLSQPVSQWIRNQHGRIRESMPHDIDIDWRPNIVTSRYETTYSMASASPSMISSPGSSSQTVLHKPHRNAHKQKLLSFNGKSLILREYRQDCYYISPHTSQSATKKGLPAKPHLSSHLQVMLLLPNSHRHQISIVVCTAPIISAMQATYSKPQCKVTQTSPLYQAVPAACSTQIAIRTKRSPETQS